MNIWQQQFPPFTIWLYGRLTRASTRCNAYAMNPSDAWRFHEENLKEVPQPENLIQKIVCYFVKAKLKKQIDGWHKLDNSGVCLTGYIPFTKE